MKYSYSGEVDAKIADLYIKISAIFASTVKDLLIKHDEIASIDLIIGYVPILIFEDRHNRYKPRTKVVKSKNLLESAPKLDPSPFYTGSEVESLKVFVDGLVSDLWLLHSIGLSEEKIFLIEKFFREAELKTRRRLSGN